MDPKQDNQGGNDTGDNRQAIFTPQPTITDASATTPESAQASDGSSTHPYFSSHPTQTFNTDTGDIIIKNNEPKPKQNKRPFIIGGIILAVFVVICAIILAVIANSPNNKPTSKANEAELKFNQFATYLLYKQSSDKLSGEYEEDKTYELDLQLESNSIDEKYWNTASELLNEAVETATQDESITRYLVRSLQSYHEYFDFIRVYRQNGAFDETRLQTSYISSGTNSATTLVNNFYSQYDDLKSDIATVYVQQRKQQYDDMISLFTIYRELGCIQDGNINEKSCSANISTAVSQRFQEVSKSVVAARTSADKTLKNAINYLKSRCWELSQWLQNPIDERDQGDSNAE